MLQASSGVVDGRSGDPAQPSRLRDLWRYTAAQPGRMIAAMLLSAAAAVLALCQPLLVNSIISAVTAGQRPVRPVALLVALMLAGAAISAASSYVLAVMAERGTLRVRRDYMRAVLRMPMWWYARRPVGDLVARATSDVKTLKYALSSGFVDIVGNILLVVGATVALLVLDPALTLIVVCLVTASALVVVAASPRIRQANRSAQDAVGTLGSRLQQAVGAMRIIRPYNGTARAEQSAATAADDAYRHGVIAARLQSMITPISTVLSQGSLVAIFLIGGWRVAAGELTLADLLTFALFVSMLVSPATSVIGAILALQEALGALDRVREVTEAPHAPIDPSPPVERPSELTPTGLVIRDISYRYPGSETDALTAISLDVAPGERIALIGASGAGKSTLFSLLLGHDAPSAGRIDVGGVTLGQGDNPHLRNLIGHVDQAVHVLPDTIRENITAGLTWPTDDDVLEVLRQVGLDGLIDELPAGIGSNVGEDGALLSGGERQRLAIARALLHRRPVLLLDEPSSSLDAESERLVADAIETVPRGVTVLTIAHRYSTIRAVDRVAVLEHGHLITIGTPEQVAASSPTYRTLVLEA